MLVTVAALCALALLVSASGANAVTWRRNREGAEIVRALVPLRAPAPLGTHPRDILLFAGRKNEKNAEALFWHWTVDHVPRKAVLYFKRRNEEAEEESEEGEGSSNAPSTPESQEPPSAAAMFLRVGLWKLVEYEDRDSTPGYDPVLGTPSATEDRPLQQVVLYNAGPLFPTWSPMTVRVREADGRVYKAIKVCTNMDRNTNQALNSTLNIELCVQWAGTRNRFTGDNADTDPNAAKWSLRIQNWPWTSTPNSKLALKVSMDTLSAARDPDPETRQEAAAANQEVIDLGEAEDGAQALATWVRTVDVSGGSCPAGTTEADVTKGIFYDREATGETEITNNPAPTDDISFVRAVQVSYFNFETTCKPDDIVWDPEIGIVTVDAAPTTASVFVALIVAALALLF